MKPVKYDSPEVKQRLDTAKDRVVTSLAKRMGVTLHPDANDLYDKLVSAEYHDLRWGWYYILTHEALPSLLFKVSYNYESNEYSTTAFQSQWTDRS